MARIRGSVTTFPHQDHLGSPIVETGLTGAVNWREAYSVYGEKRLDPVGNRDNEGFTGHIDDAASGLTYMQARYYDPVIGQFLSNDPVGFAVDKPQMFNRYSYALNDPVNMVDPDGEQATFLEGLSEAVAEKGTEEEKEVFGQGVAQGVGISAGLLPVGRASLFGRSAVGGFLLRQGASKSFGGASKFIANTTQGFAKTSGRSGRDTFQSFGSGGQKGAEKLFNILTKGKSESLSNGGRLGKLKDGSTVQISSNNGVTSVRINQKVAETGSKIKRNRIIKVRFKEKIHRKQNEKKIDK